MKAWAVVTADAVYSHRENAERGAERSRAAGEQSVRVVEIDARAFIAQPAAPTEPAERECRGHTAGPYDAVIVYCDGGCVR
jgi:hypothetical protein